MKVSNKLSGFNILMYVPRRHVYWKLFIFLYHANVCKRRYTQVYKRLDSILKGPVMFSYAQRRKRTVYYLSVNIWVRAYYFYSPRNQTASRQYKLSKKLVQRIIEAQSVLPYSNRNKTLVPVFYFLINTCLYAC